MEITIDNHTLSPVVLFSVDLDSVSKQERKEGVIPPGGSNSFYVPGSYHSDQLAPVGMPSRTELRIKDFNTVATIYTYIVTPDTARRGFTKAVSERWVEQGNPERYIALNIREAQAVISEYTGLWTYRRFNPTVTRTPAPPNLMVAEANLNLQNPTGTTTLEGTFEWLEPDPSDPTKEKTEGLNLNGTVRPDIGDFFFTGTGRRGTITEDWEYRYHGHLTRNWPNAAADQRPFLVGSVLRAKSHNGVPIRSPAGVTFSFIAVKQRPPFTWELSGSWAYRGFHNEIAPQPAHELILQQAVLKLESPTDPPHTLEGAIEWPGGFLDLKGTVRHGKEFTNFELVGTGRRGTSTEGWEYRYHGYPGWGGWGERIKLVGSVFRAKAHGDDAPARSVYPFIAVRQYQY